MSNFQLFFHCYVGNYVMLGQHTLLDSIHHHQIKVIYKNLILDLTSK